MFLISGESISKGIESGKVVFYKKTQLVRKNSINKIEDEIKRFSYARETAMGELQVLYEKSVENIGQENALVFGIHQMLIEDVEFVDEVCQVIRHERVNAEYAIDVVSKKWEEILRKQKRAEDMRDVSLRLLRILTETKELDVQEENQILLVAEDLLPSEIVRLDAKRISGIVLLRGNSNSHTAIFVKAMGIPMIIQAIGDWDEKYVGKQAIIDGKDGKVYVEANIETAEKLMEKQQCERKIKERQQEYQNKKTKMRVCANIGSFEEAELAVIYAADGIGLVRSEMFCLEANRILDEEEQFKIYKKLAEMMDGKPVVIRTWDFGEDKQLEQWKSEENRGIRWCLEHKELFEKQLRAICRASIYGTIAVMFPMVSTLEELKEAKQILLSVQDALKRENVPIDGEMKIGVMLETPASIMISRELAKQVEFCSVGTNDLIQYTFGLNRQKAVAKEFYEECYPTLFNMLHTAVSNVHTEGKKIGICGELGADLTMTEMFANMKMDELSVAPSSILEVREAVLKTE